MTGLIGDRNRFDLDIPVGEKGGPRWRAAPRSGRFRTREHQQHRDQRQDDAGRRGGETVLRVLIGEVPPLTVRAMLAAVLVATGGPDGGVVTADLPLDVLPDA
ncbi:hypothetical protein [Cryptosporangium aurantiacum]|uniref:Uncharacterized protein n=1 Tax=Cryptosporangium aurantiacum TaxID=134849 RepID=A0A1M7TUI5_9ACTN|nr:hypothetical protein [Cryptosporangium aurantiacum]SHN74360.1 hypothetical protein SAMN05443668_10766 [Cryptosporangium aurantiacum]